MNFNFKIFLAFAVMGMFSAQIMAQSECKYQNGVWIGDCPNPVQTAVPFLRIPIDARTGGMGDIGIASAPDASAIYYNSAKMAFNDDPTTLGISYTPWLRELVNDVYLVAGNGSFKLDDLSAIGFGLRYFNMGQIDFVDNTGTSTGTGNPNEFALELAYARRLGENFGIGVNGRYIRSDLAGGQTVNNIEIKPGNAGAVDISFFYDKEFNSGNNLSAGLSLTNMGSQISYTETGRADYIPANLGFGLGYTLNFDEYNRLTFLGELNKLMVPTRPDSLVSNDGDDIPDYLQQGVLESMINSFSDSDAELDEWIYSLGLEYVYNDLLSVRAGYFHEAKLKGNRQHFTVGVGLKYNVVKFDFSYLINANGQINPLNNTLRFSLNFLFGQDKISSIEDIN